jgi:hypothetical protein
MCVSAVLEFKLRDLHMWASALPLMYIPSPDNISYDKNDQWSVKTSIIECVPSC